MIGYFEDQAVISYTQYLEEIENGKVENTDAPQIATDPALKRPKSLFLRRTSEKK